MPGLVPILLLCVVATAKTLPQAVDPPPTAVDWRTKGVVAPVRSQGMGGASQLDALTDAIASAIAIASGSSSPPALLPGTVQLCTNATCPTANQDCIYQYAQEKGLCLGMECDCDHPLKLASTQIIPPNDEPALQRAVVKGPVAIAVEADQPPFQDYTGGIESSTACGTKVDHGMVLVGYGTENGEGYWLARNSWGTTCEYMNPAVRGKALLPLSQACVFQLDHSNVCDARWASRGRGGLYADQARQHYG